jgi:hypothetical protein
MLISLSAFSLPGEVGKVRMVMTCLRSYSWLVALNHQPEHTKGHQKKMQIQTLLIECQPKHQIEQIQYEKKKEKERKRQSASPPPQPLACLRRTMVCAQR